MTKISRLRIYRNDDALTKIVVSFYKITTLTPTFLNVAIGQLYGEFSQPEIRSVLRLEDMDHIDLALVQRVIENAKLYFVDVRNA
jgi:hypothetical protein